MFIQHDLSLDVIAQYRTVGMALKNSALRQHAWHRCFYFAPNIPRTLQTAVASASSITPQRLCIQRICANCDIGDNVCHAYLLHMTHSTKIAQGVNWFPYKHAPYWNHSASLSHLIGAVFNLINVMFLIKYSKTPIFNH